MILLVRLPDCCIHRGIVQKKRSLLRNFSTKA
jgi:hypothetical protein